MKKTVLVTALALCGMGSALAQSAEGSKVQLWGIVDMAVRHTTHEGADQKSLTRMVGGGMSQSRWGLNIEEDLGGGTKALAHLEHRFNADSGDKNLQDPYFQLSYVGLQGPYGRLTAGRQWNVLFDVVTSTYASYPYSPYMDAYKPELGMAMGARASNMLKYTVANQDKSLAGALQYSFDENNDTKAIEAGFPGNAAQVPDLVRAQVLRTIAGGAWRSMGGFVRYKVSDLAVGGGFMRVRLPGGTDVDAWTLGGSYRTGPWYFNAGYGHNKAKFATPTSQTSPIVVRNAVDRAFLNAAWGSNIDGGFASGDANKRDMIKVGLGYQLNKQINIGGHYYHAKQKGSASGAFNGKANFYTAAVDYAFSKRTDAYMEVDHTRIRGGGGIALDASGARNRTGFTVGLRHRF